MNEAESVQSKLFYKADLKPKRRLRNGRKAEHGYRRRNHQLCRKALCKARGWKRQLRDIADELGISKGTLHYYFKTKEDLICSCAENCVAVIGDGVFELMNGAARGGSAESVCEKFVSAFFDDASLPKLLVGLLCCECGRAAEICRSAIEEWRVMFEVAALRLSPRSEGKRSFRKRQFQSFSGLRQLRPSRKRRKKQQRRPWRL